MFRFSTLKTCPDLEMFWPYFALYDFFLQDWTYFYIFDGIDAWYISSLQGYLWIFYGKIWYSEIFYFGFRLWNLVLNFFFHLSHNRNFDTWFNKVLPFRWHWHLALLVSRWLFFGKLFQIVLFRFSTWKSYHNLNFCSPHLILCKLWYHGLVYSSFGIY